MTQFFRMLQILLVLAIAMYLFQLAPRVMALSALGYAKPWLAVLPFGTEYAYADLSLGDSDGLYVLDWKVPAPAVRWYGLICFALGFLPVIGSIANIAIRISVGGPCFAWALAALEDQEFKQEGLKGALTAFFPDIGSIILIVALVRRSRMMS